MFLFLIVLLNLIDASRERVQFAWIDQDQIKVKLCHAGRLDGP